jgi:hypothetical protein
MMSFEEEFVVEKYPLNIILSKLLIPSRHSIETRILNQDEVEGNLYKSSVY